MESGRNGKASLRQTSRICLTIVAIAVIVAMAPAWLAIMRPDPIRPRDFVQDWASARNVLTGRPVYTDQRQTLPDYIGRDTRGGLNVVYNAHPPTSVLVTVPFALLDYATAGWWWNVLSLVLLVVSLALLARGIGWQPTGWAIAPIVALLMLWVPLWLHTLQGQLGLLLLALFTGAWWAGRQGRWVWCGALLGAAATIKLFPILLLGLLMLLGRWRGVVAGMAAAAGLTILTGAALGIRAYIDYATVVVPQLDRWRPDWINSSLTGFFAHLFAPDTTIEPFWHNPTLAVLVSGLAGLVVIGVVAWAAWQHGRTDFDGVYTLALTGLLLLSALTWSHYFVVLLIPLVIWARRLWLAGRAAAGRWAVLGLCWLLMALPQLDLARAVIGGDVAGPVHAVTVLALNFYGLLGFFAAQAWWLRTTPRLALAPAGGEQRARAPELVTSGERRA